MAPLFLLAPTSASQQGKALGTILFPPGSEQRCERCVDYSCFCTAYTRRHISHLHSRTHISTRSRGLVLTWGSVRSLGVGVGEGIATLP